MARLREREDYLATNRASAELELLLASLCACTNVTAGRTAPSTR